MASRSREYVLDELLCFLSNPIFQVPVLTFMEDRCMIFDPEIEDSSEYRKTHEDYKRLVDRMLLSFEQDTGLDYKAIMGAVQEMNDKEDIRTVFQTVLEQVMSSVDFGLFVRVMAHKNIVLQEEALKMIMKNLGALPGSLTHVSKEEPRRMNTRQKEEDAVLAAAMEKSRQEFENQKRMSSQEEKEMKAVLEISMCEAKRLSDSRQVEEKKIDMALKSGSSGGFGNVAVVPPVSAGSHDATVQPTSPSKPATDLRSAPKIAAMPAASRPPQATAASPKSPTSATGFAPLTSPVQNKHVDMPKASGVSNADAAANWMKSAQNESSSSVQQSERYQAMQKSMEAMSLDERQQRLKFLKEQRDKLVKMKKEEREKQLRRVESAQPQRPQSARAARAAMSGKTAEPEKRDPEMEKRLAMRKAIADRLKSEVIDRHH
ncbi:cilia- and flagella-associated protein 36-like isoform X1 [Haliotis rubra]|uniref:cilia- and flagella-associated protein 36-like isoform X1 n=1 Tax=Haliotis rubra TaxID=36100 RepID=UPI001EE572BD|nr:cilia- and flagella-associated protein 36-like isoform X1 [Haliotis rubra]XP_046564391.1 cilia- and flagella-associated protein 36-like isoform X1 [Haliotis rubra]XP_046564394.1 cilia- and flagella-associated protein 36-like isoform X1 [Haliotis rubra]